jgi:DNA-binding CsgD family transcriptional regulator
LLERDDELRAIDGAIADARAERGAHVVIEGPPGAGKTMLLAAARERAAAGGMLVLHARGGQLEREFSFGVARQLFESLLLEATPAERDGVLDGAAAVAAPLVGVARESRSGDASDGGADAAFQSLHGLFWLTANVAAKTPLMLVVDDLQWCDAGSLRWLAYLTRRVEGLALLVLAGVHAADVGARPPVLAEAIAEARVLRPAPLGRGSVALLIRDALAADPDDEFCATCHEATGGLPLLVRELLAALAEEGVVPDATQTERVRELGSQAIAPLVRLRLARLGPDAQALVGAAAILGDDAVLSHAAALAEIGEAAATTAAAQLSQAGLLRLDATLSFTHPLERAAIYETIAPLQREGAHARAARLLWREHAPPEQIAGHLLHADSIHDPFALEILRDAARAALSHGSADIATAYLRRALPVPVEAGARVEVLVELALAEKLIDLPAAIEHLREALALIGDDERRAQLGAQLARTLFLAGRPEEAVAAFEQAIALLSPGRGELRSRLVADLLAVTILHPELYPIAEYQLARIEPAAVGDGVGGGMLRAMTAYHDALGGCRRKACADRAERALAGGALLGEEASNAFAYACRVLIVADRFEATAAGYERALEHAQARGSITSFAVGVSFRSGLAFYRGELAEAEADAQAAVDAALEGGVATALPIGLTYLTLALLEQGKLETASARLDQFAHKASAFAAMPFFLLARARLRRAAGDAEGALVTVREAARGFAATGQVNPAIAAWRSVTALTHLDLDDAGAARAICTEEVRLARMWGAPRTLGRALRVAGQAEGDERGLAQLRESLAVLARSPARLERAETLVELGAAVRRGGNRVEARGFLRRGLDLADDCGAHPLSERARTELRVAGARPRRARLSGPESLTPSEQRVAAMAAEGMTNRAIAQALFVTSKTVEVHLSGAYRKLDIRSRMQLPKALEP